MDKENLFQSSDRDTVVLLLTAGLPIVKYFADPNGKTQFVFDNERAESLITSMIRNELPNYPYDAYVKATRMFNSIVHSR